MCSEVACGNLTVGIQRFLGDDVQLVLSCDILWCGVSFAWKLGAAG